MISDTKAFPIDTILISTFFSNTNLEIKKRKSGSRFWFGMITFIRQTQI
ncbi:hypothetical protein CLU81_5076 [Flavobacterium sp. 9]|nr:hypothetical protein CLU81_5076 [Flavobacterium sp. 9]